MFAWRCTPLHPTLGTPKYTPRCGPMWGLVWCLELRGVYNPPVAHSGGPEIYAQVWGLLMWG